MAEFKENNTIIPNELPLIALKNTVLFPKLIIPLLVQRSKSMTALGEAMTKDKLVFFASQKNIDDDVDTKDIFEIGTIGRIVSVFKLPDGSSKVDVEGLVRARISDFLTEEPFFKVKIEPSLLLVRNNLEEKAM